MSQQLTLGVETSCDETSAAILRGEGELLGHVILSQDIHLLYGGVVPELASRAHLRTLDEVVRATLDEAGVALEEIDLIGVTAGPGLIGALLVGVAWCKGLGWALGKPVVGVHHMEAHLFAAQLENPGAEPPFVALLVSGGHTMLLWTPAWGEYHLLGETRDDAVGEAFDKAAKMLGLPYPGGPSVQRLAATGDASRHPLPRPLVTGRSRQGDAEYYDFSYSGLKTALRVRIQELNRQGVMEAELAHLAASFQEAAIDVLAVKTMRAVKQTGCSRVVLGGGVANSQLLRSRLEQQLSGNGELFYPSPRLATDNAAMIARTAIFRYQRDGPAGLDLNARADLHFPGLSVAG
ncbi:tRNA (adenosine(37)-N6)-threonylcarbamoyltransferase complex transferase subunit TsaD [soil metagenome]